MQGYIEDTQYRSFPHLVFNWGSAKYTENTRTVWKLLVEHHKTQKDSHAIRARVMDEDIVKHLVTFEEDLKRKRTHLHEQYNLRTEYTQKRQVIEEVLI